MSAAVLIEHLVQGRQRALGVPGPQVDARQQRLCFLDRVGRVRGAEYAQGAGALSLGGRELPLFDVRFADPLIGERDPLLVGERDAERCGLCVNSPIAAS